MSGRGSCRILALPKTLSGSKLCAGGLMLPSALSLFSLPVILSCISLPTSSSENILSETAKRCRLSHVSFNGSSRYCSCCRFLTGPTCCCCYYFFVFVFVFVYSGKLLMTKSPQLSLAFICRCDSREKGDQLHLHYKRQLPTAP